MQSHTIHKNKLGWSFKNIDIWKVNVTVYLHSHMLSSSSGSITLNHLYLNSWVIPDGLINIFIPLLIDLLTFSQFSSVAQSSQHARPPCPSPTPGVHPNSCASSQWCHPAISSSVVPVFSCPQPLPASESFPMSQLFAWGGQSIGVSASASVLPKNTQDWSPLGWTGWISLQSKGLTRVFSNTFQKHQFFSTQPSSQSNSHIHTWPLEKPHPWLDGPLLAK